MKLNYFIFFILLFPTSFFAQDYIPLVVEDKHWIYGGCGTQGGETQSFYEYLLRGDTLINGETYKKIFHRNFQIPVDSEGCEHIENGVSKPYIITSNYYVGAVREDIEQKKVWLFPEDGYNWFECFTNEEELLLFDFSQELGDSAILCSGFYDLGIEAITLQSIGEIVNYHGERKVNRYENEYNIYEGIGHYLGLQMPFQLFFWVDDGQFGLIDVCQGTDFECLFDNTAVHNILPTESVKVIPSPSNGNFTLQLEREIEKNTTLQIISNQGQIVLKKQINNPVISIETDLPTGLYFLSIMENGRQIWSGKTIIKN